MDKQAPLFLYQPWHEHKPGNEKREWPEQVNQAKKFFPPFFSKSAHTQIESS